MNGLTNKQLMAVHDKMKLITGKNDFWNHWEEHVGRHKHDYDGVRYEFIIHSDSRMEIIEESKID